MLKINIKSLTTCIGKVWKQNGHKLLTDGAVIGILVTTGFAIADTVKAVKKVEEKKPETKKELVKTAAPCYIRTGVSLVATTACVFGAKHKYEEAAKQISNLASTLVLSETARKEYEEAAKEVVGEEKEQEIRDKVAEKQVAKRPFVNREVVVADINSVRCFDSIAQKYFENNRLNIEQEAVNANREISGEMQLSFLDWLERLGVRVDYSDPIRERLEDLGWNVDHPISLSFGTTLCSDGVPALVIFYDEQPSPTYTDWGRYG